MSHIAAGPDDMHPGESRPVGRPTRLTVPGDGKEVVHGSDLQRGQLVWWGREGVGLDERPYSTISWWVVTDNRPPTPGRLGIADLYSVDTGEADDVTWAYDVPTDLVLRQVGTTLSDDGTW